MGLGATMRIERERHALQLDALRRRRELIGAAVHAVGASVRGQP